MEFKLPNRPKNSNKGTFGKVLNIAGSWNYQGAAYLSSVSALRVGAGLVALSADEQVVKSVATQSPDIVFLDRKDVFNVLENYTVISIGCGLGVSQETKHFFIKFLEKIKDFETPVILDASALQMLSEMKTFELPKNSILTPHPGEASRLLDVPICEIVDKSEYFSEILAEKYKAIVLLKGQNTKVYAPDGRFYVNKTGSSALAKAGSGDVLTGMISGLIAQKMDLFDATCLAAHLHGLAGELAGKDLSEYCVLASELLNYVPKAIKSYCE